MGFFSKITDWLGLQSPSVSSSPINRMQEAVERARLAKRNENYTAAWDALSEAIKMANENQDTHSVTILALHQTDLLIEQARYDEADQVLQQVKETAASVHQRGFSAYIQIMQGRLYMGQNQYDQARDELESARTIAQNMGELNAEGRALGHLADIYLQDDNTSYAIHLLQEAIPKLTQAGDTESLGYFTGRLGEAMTRNDQITEGRRILDQALRQAEHAQDMALIRRWSLALGKTAFQQGKYDEAAMFYQKSLTMLEHIPQTQQIEAYINLSQAHMMLGQMDKALTYAQKAIELTQPNPNTEQFVQAAGTLGMIHQNMGQNEQAIVHLEQALQNPPKDKKLYFDLTRTLALAYEKQGNLESATQLYEQAIAKADESQNLRAKAELQRDYGLLHIQRNDLQQALELWSQALVIFENEGLNNQTAQLYCDLANARYQLGMGKRAMRDYESALVALNHINDLKTRGVVLSNAANVYANQGDIESTRSFFQESIEIAQTIKDKTSESTRLGNYGWFLNATGKPREAIEQLTKALEISREHDMTLQQAVQTDNLGLAYGHLSQYKTALGYHEDAQKIVQQLDPAPKHWLAIFQAHTANSLLRLERAEEAQPLAEAALNLARQTTNLEALTISLITMARYYVRQNQPNSATTLIDEAKHIARRAEMRHTLAEVMRLSSEHQAALNNLEQAQKDWEEAQEIARLVSAPQAKQLPAWLLDTSG